MDMYYFFPVVIGVIAFLYASVGHGGASGYLATMALTGISPAEMKSSALILNIFVSAIAFFQYYRGGFFKWKLLWPFILLSVPFAFIGAKIPLNDQLYKSILAVCLGFAILRLLGVFGKKIKEENRPVNLPLAIFCGAVIGIISGMIGIGGGILLSPLLIILRWADVKEAAIVSAAFIFLNSIAGLVGNFTSGFHFTQNIYVWIIAAVIGGTIGAYAGSRRINSFALKYILSGLLLFACYKLVIT